MKPRFLLAPLLAVAVLLGFSSPAAALPREIEGFVIRVTDGDTITVATTAGSKSRVRLYGIDAPEIRHKDRPGQAYGRESRVALKEKAYRMPVRVEIVDVDSYGRLVGVVFLGRRNINAEMVAEGYAWAYRRFLGGPYASSFIGLERKARKKKLGLWRESNPTPPWEFKRRLGVGR